MLSSFSPPQQTQLFLKVICRYELSQYVQIWFICMVCRVFIELKLHVRGYRSAFIVMLTVSPSW